MRKILCCLLIILLVASLAACTGATTAATTAATTKATTAATAVDLTKAKGKITFISAYQDPNQLNYVGYFFARLDEWKAAHPNVEVVHDGTSDWNAMLAKRKAAFAANTLPNIMYNTGAMDIQEFVEYNYIVDLKPYFDKDKEWYNMFVEACMSGCRMPGSDGIWAIPFTGQVGGLYVNMKLLNDAGITKKPTTVEELEADLDILLKQGKVVPWENGCKSADNIAACVIAIIGKLYGPNWVEDVYSGKTKYSTSPEFKQAMELFKKWMKAGYFGKDFWDADVTANRNLYYAMGTAFMYSNGHIVSVAMQKSVDKSQISYMTFPYFKDKPQFEGTYAAGVGDHFSVCDTGTQIEKDLSVDFLKYATITSNFQKNAEIQNFALFPVVKGIVYPAKLEPMVQDFQDALKKMQNGNRPATHDAFGAEAREVMLENMAKYLRDTITIDECANNIQTVIEKALAAVKKK